MSDELDLETGNPELADASPSARRRAARRSADTGRGSKSDDPPKRKTPDSELQSALRGAFDRLAKMLHERQDEELAVAIDEEAAAMSEGIMSLTRSIKWLRFPILVSLNLIISGLAFGRVGGILWTRFTGWRWRKAAEAEARAAGVTRETGNSEPAYAGT